MPFHLYVHVDKRIEQKNTMSKHLFEHINKHVSINPSTYKEILKYFDEQNLNKKELILSAGVNRNLNLFVIKGCMHMYFIDDKGHERTVQFAIDNWWMTDYLAYHKNEVSKFYIQTIEETQLLAISYSKQEQLLTRFPELEKYFRIIYQISYGASIMKMKYLLEFSKEEIYFHFTNHFPDFAQKVPQYLIASFLGLTPEYVSKIRALRRS